MYFHQIIIYYEEGLNIIISTIPNQNVLNVCYKLSCYTVFLAITSNPNVDKNYFHTAISYHIIN